MSRLIKIQKPKYIDELKEIVDLKNEFIYEDNIVNKS